jgi:hypothetical protein
VASITRGGSRRKLFHHLQQPVCLGIADDMQRELRRSFQSQLQNLAQLRVGEIRSATPAGLIAVGLALKRVLFDRGAVQNPLRPFHAHLGWRLFCRCIDHPPCVRNTLGDHPAGAIARRFFEAAAPHSKVCALNL